MSAWNISPQAASLLEKALVWDNHGCMPNPLKGKENKLNELRRYRESGVNVAMINIGDAEVGLAQQIEMAAIIRHWVETNSDDYVMISSVSDIEEAQKSGKLAVGLDVEGARVIGDQLSLVSLLYKIGVRWMLVAYNANNLVGGGCHDTDTGLTKFGVQVMDEMDRVGMIKCCTHTGYKTAMEVFERSSLPVIMSHSNPRALKDHQRNVPDDIIRACADTGGVQGICGVGLFLGDNDTRTETVLRHIDYVATLVGPEHVGIGFDYVFDQASMAEELTASKSAWPVGHGYDQPIDFVKPEQVPDLSEGMVRMGYSEKDMMGILGGNWMRVAKAVWK